MGFNSTKVWPLDQEEDLTECIVKWNNLESASKGYKAYEPNYVEQFFKCKQRSVIVGLISGTDYRGSAWDSLKAIELCYVLVMWWLHIYAFVLILLKCILERVIFMWTKIQYKQENNSLEQKFVKTRYASTCRNWQNLSSRQTNTPDSQCLLSVGLIQYGFLQNLWLSACWALTFLFWNISIILILTYY